MHAFTRLNTIQTQQLPAFGLGLMCVWSLFK